MYNIATEYYQRHFITKTSSNSSHTTETATNVSSTTMSKTNVILLAVLATLVAVAVIVVLAVEVVYIWRRQATGAVRRRAHSMSKFRLLRFFSSPAIEKSSADIDRCQKIAGS